MIPVAIIARPARVPLVACLALSLEPLLSHLRWVIRRTGEGSLLVWPTERWTCRDFVALLRALTPPQALVNLRLTSYRLDRCRPACHLLHPVGMLINWIRIMTHLRLFTWNVCGAGSRGFLSSMFEYLRMYKPPILALFETRISGSRADEVCRKLGFSGCFRVEAQGFAGGIWILWDAAEVQLNLITSHPQYVTMEVRQRGAHPWFFTAIYASPMGHVREFLWCELE